MRRLMWFTVGYTAAVLLFVYGLLPWWLLLLTGAACTGFLCFFRLGKFAFFRVVGLGLLIGAVWCTGYAGLFVKPLEVYRGTSRNFTVEVTGYPATVGYSRVVEGRIAPDGRVCRCSVYISEKLSSVRPGDILHGKGTVRVSEDDPNSGDFYGATKGRWLRIVPDTVYLEKCKNSPWWTFPADLSHMIAQNIRALFPEDVRGIFLALTTGDRSEISYSQRTDMSVCGIYHSVALSGMHVAILASMMQLLCGGNRKLSAVLGIPIIWIFVLLSGAAASTCRAAVMQTVLLSAPIFRREYDSPTSLSASLLLILSINPYAIADYGLQLSYTSTIGILAFAGRIQNRMIPVAWRKNRWLAPVRNGLSAIAVSLSAIVLSQPLLSVYFGLASVAALPVNMIALWAVSVCFAGGLALALLAIFVFVPASALAWALAWFARYFLLIVRIFARIPFAAVYTENPFLFAWVEFAYVFIVICLLLGVRRKIPLACLAGTLLLSLFLWWHSLSGQSFSLLDVGQGLCAVYKNDEAIMVDCGGDEDATGELAARYLLSNGVFHLDSLVLTHFDTDHVGGVAQLLHRIPVERVFVTSRGSGSKVERNTLQTLKDCGVQIIYPENRVPLLDGTVQILPPVVEEDNDNNGCLSVVFRKNSGGILITGDMNTAAEEELLNRWDIQNIDVLVAGHHGSSAATGETILDALQPSAVLISVGENTYGHPNKKTIRRIQARGIPVYTTMENGTMTLEW